MQRDLALPHLRVTAIRQALKSDAYRNCLKQVQVKAEADRIILFGEVKTYFLKQTAQTIAMRVLADSAPLLNQISVDYGSQL